MSFITDFPAILDVYRAQRGIYIHQHTVEDETPKNTVLYSLLKKQSKKKTMCFNLEEVGSVIQRLIGDFYQPLYMVDQRYNNLHTEAVLEGHVSCAVSTIDVTAGGLDLLLNEIDSTDNHRIVKGLTKYLCVDSRTGEQYVLHDFDTPARELFIWAVLLNRFDMAKVFWEEGKSSIMAALVAQKMLKSMSNETDDTEIIQELNDNVMHFAGVIGRLKVDILAPATALHLRYILIPGISSSVKQSSFKCTKSSIMAALVAQKMLKSMSNETDDTEIIQELNDNVMKFSELAVGVLSECHTGDEQRAGMLLVGLQENWGKATAVQLAVVADNKQFISHAACQTLLNTIWRGRMASEVSMWRIWLCILFPPLIYVLMKYRLDHREELNRRTVRIKKSKITALKAAEKACTEDSKALLVTDESTSDGGIGKATCIEKLIFFYNAPMVTFIHNAIFYIFFLLLYIYIMLVKFNPTTSVHEYILIAWVFTMFTEEIRQVVMDESYSFRLKVRNYVSDVWNILDMISIVSFIMGLILRVIPTTSCQRCFDAARIVFSLNLMVFIFRLLHIMEYHKELGPKLVMIRRMLIDLVYFLIILVVFILAHGVALQANLYPNTPLSAQLIFVDIFKKSYWQIYGELFLEELEGTQPCTNNATAAALDKNVLRCPQNEWVGSVLLVVHIMLTNVLMLNLLIAMFSYTFNKIQINTDAVWKFQRFDLVKEYYDKPPLAPPIIIFAHIFELVAQILRRCGCNWYNPGNTFKIKLNEDEQHQLLMWENLNQEEYIRNTHAESLSTLDNQVSATHDRVNHILTKVEEVSESNFMMGSTASSSASSSAPKLPPVLDERMTTLEEQMKRTSQALDWIIQSMMEKGTGAKSGPPKLLNVEALKTEAAQKKIALEEKEKEQYKQMLKRQLELHVKSRIKHYPCSSEIVYRFEVPDDKVEWSIEWPEYDPLMHTDKSVLDGPDWADMDLMSMDPARREMLRWNDLDGVNRVDRRSFLGKYDIKKGLPINPKGRTGLTGRGLLGRWGPNHAGDPVVTRWAKNQQGEQIKNNDKPVLEFVSVQRDDTKQWAIPGGLMQLDQSVDQALKAEFTEEALGKLPEELRLEVKYKITQLFRTGVEVYKGYSDDPRNTDNSWVETTALNYHDEDGILTHFALRAGGHAEMVRWMRISTQESLYAAHIAILQKVASRLKADF